MATDLYAKCPCGSGKKIKFCCRDIISDIERIERMLRGDQRHAALEKIDKLLGKHTDRPALLSLKAQVFFELKQIDDARPVIDRLLELEPDHPTALCLQAMLTANDGDVPGALRLFHRALRMSDGMLSSILYRCYVAICMHLIQIEAWIAAYAHLLTLVSVTKGEDGTSFSMLMNVTSSEKLPAVFQGLLMSRACPDHVTWKREFELAYDLYRHGDWSEAAVAFEGMNARILDEPVLLRNLAILQAWTLQNEKAAETFRRYTAIRGLDLDDAVEAEACAQVLEPVTEEDGIDVVKLTYEINDANDSMERFLSCDTAKSVPVEPNPADADTPPPKGRFILFDRPEAASEGQLTLADLPREYGTVTIHGRETDRPARLVLSLFKDDHYVTNLRRIEQISGQTLDPEAETELLGRIHKVYRLFRPDFRVPRDTTVDRHQEFTREWIDSQLENVWPTISLSYFGNQSAIDAVRDPKLRKAVLAAILNLELWADRQPAEFDFNRLRQKLDLPVREPIDPNDVEIRSLSPGQLFALDLLKTSDDDLVFLFEAMSMRPNGRFLYRIGSEVLKRPALDGRIDFVEVHERLADLAPTTEGQLEHLKMARDIAVGRGESPAHWLVHELDVRLRRREVELAKRLVSEIQSRYLREPGIAQSFATVLSRFGLLPTNGKDGLPATDVAAEPVGSPATTTTSQVWTPESEAGAAAEAAGGEKSKLWVPGMD